MNSAMSPLTKIRLCVILNIFLLTTLFSLLIHFSSHSTYFQFGPNDNFIVISVKINTIERYYILLLLIAFINIAKVIISEMGEPVLVFNVYNPDKKLVTDFTKFQLKFYANLMFILSNVRRVFDIMVTVTQIDIALYSVLVEQITSFFTVNMLVNEKEFLPNKDMELLEVVDNNNEK
jgi:hypothetical protein